MKIKTYDELNIGEKEIIDSFCKMKLLYDHFRFKLYNHQIDDLINDYQQLKQLRQNIQEKYFSIFDQLQNETLLEGEIDTLTWAVNRETENDVWASEIRLMDRIKTDFEIAINMIESGEAERNMFD